MLSAIMALPQRSKLIASVGLRNLLAGKIRLVFGTCTSSRKI
jgi:hypothetical protein